MRFGMSGCFLPEDMDALTPEMCRHVRELGFSGIFTRFRKNNPNDTPKWTADRVKQVLADSGIHLYQATGFWQNLVNSDENRRADAVKTHRKDHRVFRPKPGYCADVFCTCHCLGRMVGL